MSAEDKGATEDAALARRTRVNRTLALVAVAFLAIGVALNQVLVTWLNATLL